MTMDSAGNKKSSAEVRLPDRGHLDARRFLIAVKRLADSLSYGADRSPYLGGGVEYAQSRLYQPGDPVKFIDWRVTARTGKPYLKEYETPRRLPAYLLIDTSASMMVGSWRHTKYDTALFVAGGLAFACLDRVSPVGVLGVGDRAFHVRPSLSRDRILQWLHDLRRHRTDEHTRLSAKIRELAATLTQRSLVFVLSDLHEADALGSLKQLGQRHDCVVLQFRDPAEDGLKGAGFLRAREAETHRGFVTHGRAQWLKHQQLAEKLKKGAIDHLVIRVDQPYAHRLRRFLADRGLLGRGAR